MHQLVDLPSGNHESNLWCVKTRVIEWYQGRLSLMQMHPNVIMDLTYGLSSALECSSFGLLIFRRDAFQHLVPASNPVLLCSCSCSLILCSAILCLASVLTSGQENMSSCYLDLGVWRWQSVTASWT